MRQKIQYGLDFEGPDEAPTRFAVFASVVPRNRTQSRYTIPVPIAYACDEAAARRLIPCLEEEVSL
jgi:hypothetical protein